MAYKLGFWVSAPALPLTGAHQPLEASYSHLELGAIMAPSINRSKNEMFAEEQGTWSALTVSVSLHRATLTNSPQGPQSPHPHFCIWVFRIQDGVLGPLGVPHFCPCDAEGRQLHITVAITGWLASETHREDGAEKDAEAAGVG